MVAHCKICHRQFAKQYRLNEHMRSHTGEKPFKCEECAAVFRFKGSLRRHAVSHLTDRQLFRCMLCRYSTHLYERLERHAKTHKGGPRFLKSAPGSGVNKRQVRHFKCSHCLAEFRARSEDIIAHLASHTGVKPFKCERCGDEFLWVESLSKHHGKFHDDSSKAIRCGICSNTFTCRTNLMAHMQTVHRGEKPYTCDACPKRFSTADTARRHRQAHSGERFLKCDQCPKTFLRNTQLRLHKAWVHEGVRPFKCSLCGSGFVTKAPLIAHLFSVHMGVKAFKCDICDTSFSSAGTLDVHRRIYHTSLQHRCDDCGETFKGRRHLKWHMQYHVTRYLCSECPRKFHTKPQLNKHSAFAHSNHAAIQEQFKCANCMASFSYRHNLISHHARMHKPRKLLHCKCCTKRFISYEGLRVHWRVAHTPDIPQFVCAKCSWVTNMKHSLSTHLRLMHPANRLQINCAQCESVYYNRKQLAKHIRQMHIAKTTRYGCAICGKIYTRIYRLLDHQRSVAGQCRLKRTIATN